MRSIALLFAALLLCNAAAQADCTVARGQAVTLYGGADDPDVLLWDSRDRLIRYEAGSADTRRFLLPHAILMRPGSRVKVAVCVSNVVRPKFRITAEDAVGVQITGGRYSGKYGWVRGSDIHVEDAENR